MSREAVVFRPITAQHLASLAALMPVIEGVPPPQAPPALPMITVSCEEGPYAAHFYELPRDADGESVEDSERLVAPYWMERAPTPDELAIEKRFQEEESKWNEDYWLKVEEARREGLRKLKEAQRKQSLGLHRASALDHGKGTTATAAIATRAGGKASGKESSSQLAHTVNGAASSSSSALLPSQQQGAGKQPSLSSTTNSAAPQRWNASVKSSDLNNNSFGALNITSNNAFHRETSLASVSSSVLEFMSTTSTATSTRTSERKQSTGTGGGRKASDASGKSRSTQNGSAASASSRFQISRPTTLIKPVAKAPQGSEAISTQQDGGSSNGTYNINVVEGGGVALEMFRRRGSVGSAAPMIRRASADQHPMRHDGLLKLEASPPSSSPPLTRSRHGGTAGHSPTVKISLVGMQPAHRAAGAQEAPVDGGRLGEPLSRQLDMDTAASPEATPPELPPFPHQAATGPTAQGDTHSLPSHHMIEEDDSYAPPRGAPPPSEEEETRRCGKSAVLGSVPGYLTTWTMPLCLRTRKQSSGMRRVRQAKLHAPALLDAAAHTLTLNQSDHLAFLESQPISLSSTPSGALGDLLLSSQTLTRGPFTPTSMEGMPLTSPTQNSNQALLLAGGGKPNNNLSTSRTPNDSNDGGSSDPSHARGGSITPNNAAPYPATRGGTFLFARPTTTTNNTSSGSVLIMDDGGSSSTGGLGALSPKAQAATSLFLHSLELHNKTDRRSKGEGSSSSLNGSRPPQDHHDSSNRGHQRKPSSNAANSSSDHGLNGGSNRSSPSYPPHHRETSDGLIMERPDDSASFTDEGSSGPMHSDKTFRSHTEESGKGGEQHRQQARRGGSGGGGGASCGEGPICARDVQQEESALDRTGGSFVSLPLAMNPSNLSGGFEKGWSPSPVVPAASLPPQVDNSAIKPAKQAPPMKAAASEKSMSSGSAEGKTTTSASANATAAQAGPASSKPESKGCCLIC